MSFHFEKDAVEQIGAAQRVSRHAPFTLSTRNNKQKQIIKKKTIKLKKREGRKKIRVNKNYCNKKLEEKVRVKGTMVYILYL